jgi:multidrug efflux system outer membrane protein
VVSMNLRRWIIGLIGTMTLLMNGCMVGPNYHPPKAQAPGAWVGIPTDRTGQESVATPDPVTIVEWWKSFNDPVLDSLIDEAVKSNYDLQRAEARILQARAARGVTASGLYPSVNASASAQRSYAGAGGSSAPSSQSVGAKARNLFQVGLDAAWEMDFFGGVRRSVEAANADLQAAFEDRRDVFVTLTSEVAVNYVQLRGLQQQLIVANKNLAAQQHSAEVTHKRFEVGFVSALDMANADAQVAATSAQVPLLEASVRQTIYNISVLLGREPAGLLQELSPEQAVPAMPSVVPVGLPSDLLRRRPDIRRAEAQLHGATARIGVATADLFPKFSLTGSGGVAGVTLGSLGHWSNRFWSVGPSVSLPVFSAGRIRSNIRLQNALEQDALLAYQQTVLAAFQDVENGLIAYQKEQQRRAALVRAVDANRKAVDLANRLYTAGETDFLNVLTAEGNLYSTESALAQSNETVGADLIAVYKALGGGWENSDINPVPDPPPTVQRASQPSAAKPAP